MIKHLIIYKGISMFLQTLRSFLGISCIVISCTAVQQTISQPGLYSIGSDITYFPPTSNDTIIRISANNVTLDLADHIISQGNTTSGLNAIIVDPNLSNITIQNGTLQNITGTGIVIQQNASFVTLSNITTLSCTMAFDFAGTVNNTINDCTIQDCSVVQCSQGPQLLATRFAQCLRLTMRNSFLNNNGSFTHNLQVVRLENAQQHTYQNIIINGNNALTAIRGFSLNNVSNSTFEQCIVQNNVASNSGATNIGFEMEDNGNSTGNIFNNCVALANTATNSGATAKGFAILSNNNYNTFQNCKAILNSSNDISASFTISQNTGNIFIECLADRTLSTTACQGFDIGQCTACNFIRCIISNSQGDSVTGMNFNACNDCLTTGCIVVGQVGQTSSTGINNSNSSQNVFSDNLAARNQATLAANSSGYILNNDNSSPYIKNIALRNGSLIANQYVGFNASQINSAVLSNPNSITQPWTNAGLS